MGSSDGNALVELILYVYSHWYLLDAEIIIWIVKEVLEEHQQAIDWLNENTNKKIIFSP